MSHAGITPGAVVFATEPIPFAVRQPLPGVSPDAAGQPGTGVVLWLKADDAQALHDQLPAAGVRIVAAPEDGPFGRQFSFADPEGYVIIVHGAG